MTYCKKTYETDIDGNLKLDLYGQKIIKDRRPDGKIISISSPKGKEGKFYDLFVTANKSPQRLACRMPTWDVNPTYTKKSLKEEYPNMNDQEFMMEIGAEFSGLAGENFFEADFVDSCFVSNWRDRKIENRQIGIPGNIYFAHLDPATSSHNYSLVIVHREYFTDFKTKQVDYVVIVDHIKYWHPTSNHPIYISEIDEYVLNLKKRFRLGLVTYDQFNSQESILKLRKAGIPNKMTRFTKSHKNIIYNELENIVKEGKLKIPHHVLLKGEMLGLQRRYVEGGYKVYPMKDGDGVKTDDIVDSLAGACFATVNYDVNKLPRGRTVQSPSHQDNNITWRSMQGTPYGVGPGQQVAKQLEKRGSWPVYKR